MKKYDIKNTDIETLKKWYHLMTLGRALDEKAPSYLLQSFGWSYHAAYAGLEGAVIVNKVRESDPGVGFDAYAEEYVDMVSKGILDPAKVTRSALQNATSVASTLLPTESVVATIKEDVPAMPAGGAGGMCMM